MATQSERPLVSISSIWCHLWKSNQVRLMKFSILLCPCFLKRCTFLEPYNSVLLFYILCCRTFPDTLTAKKHLAGPKMPNNDGVVLWQIKWNPKDMKSKLSPSFTLSTPLESKRPTLPSVPLSPAWITGSEKIS